VWDYQLIGSGDNELDVMLAAIKGEIVESLTAAVEEAGLYPDLVDVAPMALYNAARYNLPDASGCTLLIDIGARSTDLIFLEEGRVFIRSVFIGGNALTQGIERELEIDFDAAETLKLETAVVSMGAGYDEAGDDRQHRVAKVVRNVLTRMHAEIDRSIKFYRGQQGGGKPERVLLSGGASVIPGTDAFFREKLKVKVEYFNPFANVAVSETVEAEEIAANVNILGQVVGLALRRVLTCPIEINLMPARVLAAKIRRRRRPLFALAGVGIVLMLLTWCGFFFKMEQLAQELYDDVDAKVSVLDRHDRQLQNVQRNVKQVTRKVDDLQGLFPKRETWNRLLTEIRIHIPEGVHLVAVRPLTGPQPGEGEDETTGPGRRRGATSMFSGMMGGPGMGMPGMGMPGMMGGGMQIGDSKRFTRIEISGVGYLDKVPNLAPVRAFRDRLKASPYFSEDTNINWTPTPPRGAVSREFKIEVVLGEPLEF